jgi:DNA-binding transcriptional ArsR family regulator
VSKRSIEDRPSRVRSHGKWIEVGYLDDPPPVKARRTKRKPFKIDFTMLPEYWFEKLERCRRVGTYKLAVRILREAFKRQYIGREVVLSTTTTGMSRSARHYALRELVELGLIRTQQDGNEAVRVTELLLGDDNSKRIRRGKNGK